MDCTQNEDGHLGAGHILLRAKLQWICIAATCYAFTI